MELVRGELPRVDARRGVADRRRHHAVHGHRGEGAGRCDAPAQCRPSGPLRPGPASPVGQAARRGDRRASRRREAPSRSQALQRPHHPKGTCRRPRFWPRHRCSPRSGLQGHQRGRHGGVHVPRTRREPGADSGERLVQLRRDPLRSADGAPTHRRPPASTPGRQAVRRACPRQLTRRRAPRPRLALPRSAPSGPGETANRPGGASSPDRAGQRRIHAAGH